MNIKSKNLTKIIEDLFNLSEKFSSQIVFTTSFGIEDQVITDIIVKNNIPVRLISLDTGRLFHETYLVWQKTIDKYNCNIEAFYPDNDDVEKLLTAKGPFSFYESVADRKECCYIRKIEPLKRALTGMKYWITGIRAEQTVIRQEMEYFVKDDIYGVIKYNPLIDWTLKDVEDYLKSNNVPYNSLHNKGFVSIGCQPCTRAIKPNENFRDGRWWWENNSGKECGLHSGK